MSIQIHEDSNIGLTMANTSVEEITNSHGQHYFKASAPIGTIFGAEVHGSLEGIGATREMALHRLEEEKRKLAESLWA